MITTKEMQGPNSLVRWFRVHMSNELIEHINFNHNIQRLIKCRSLMTGTRPTQTHSILEKKD